MRIALCTIVLGDRYERLFANLCYSGWQDYAKRCGYEIVIFRRVLREMEGKSLAWQKLFILSQPELADFDKVVYVDSDILISPDAPAIHSDVPPGQIGFVLDSLEGAGSVGSWYEGFSLAAAPYVVQTGVLVLEHGHQQLLESVAGQPETRMFEMPALSQAIASSNATYPMDPRFNAVVSQIALRSVPKLFMENKILKELYWLTNLGSIRQVYQGICAGNWFIHAAGAKRDLAKCAKLLYP